MSGPKFEGIIVQQYFMRKSHAPSHNISCLLMPPHSLCERSKALMELTKKQEQRIRKLYTALKKKNKYVANLYPDPSPPDPLHRHDEAYGNTFLHMAIRYRQFELVDLLLQKLPGSLLNIINDDGDTILHELAANDDSADRADRVLRKDPELLIALNNLGEPPIFSAARHGRASMFSFLSSKQVYSYSEDVKKHLQRDDKTTVLHVAITAEHFELARCIAWMYEDLIAEKDEDGMTAFQYLACNHKAFEKKEKMGEGFLEDSAPKMKNHNRFGFKRLVRILVENDTAFVGNHTAWLTRQAISLSETIEDDTILLSIDSQTISSSETTEVERKSTVEFKIEKSQEKNMQEPHERNFPENQIQRPDEFKRKDESPLFLAIMSNISEIVEEIFRQHPSAIKHTNKDGMNVLQVAILCGNIEIFDLIINFHLVPYSLLSVTDKEQNSLLHMVCHNQKAQADKRMQNLALQLRKECIFFQKVKEACNMHIKKAFNNRFQTAEELFADKNEKLHQKAKEWLIRTTENCTILSVFIATVAFAAAYTVPGGPDQTTGIPLLNSRPWFLVFIVADVISLTLALASVGIFLSILTSSFPLQDFENSVFKKLRWGIISMVLSVSMMAVAFGATIVLAMTHNWESIGRIVVGFLPVPIFFLSYSSLRSAVLGPFLEILSTFAAKFLHWYRERLEDFIDDCTDCLTHPCENFDYYAYIAFYGCEKLADYASEAFSGLRWTVERAFSWICGKKSVERSNSRPPV